MPIRILAILAVLPAVTLGVLALAWMSDSELYFFLPSRSFGILRPPTHPAYLFWLLLFPFVVAFFSRHYALMTFLLFPLGLLLGSVVGAVAFQWTPSLCQHLLSVCAIGASAYGWSQREYFDY
jgi:hypothetical protein